MSDTLCGIVAVVGFIGSYQMSQPAAKVITKAHLQLATSSLQIAVRAQLALVHRQMYGR